MHCCSAGNHENALHAAYKFIGEPDIVEIRHSVTAAGLHSLADDAGLLVYLFQHEMRIAALLSLLYIPFGNVHGFLFREPVNIVKLNAVILHADNIVIVQKHIILCIFQKCRNIAADKILVLSNADDERRFLTGGVNPVREILEDNAQRVASLEFLYSFGDGAQRVPLGIVVIQQACDYLAVRLRLECISLFRQEFLELYVVLDYSVVHDSHAAV